MGNSSSKESYNDTAQDLPSTAGSPVPTRRPPRRKDSAGTSGQSLASSHPIAPITSVNSSHYTSPTASHSRGRSATLPTAQQRLQGIAEDDQQKRISSQASSSRRTAGSVTPNRSRSPRPPLNVDTSSTPPPDGDHPRTDSSSNPPTSASPLIPYIPTSQFGRPPRLPLPIQEEGDGGQQTSTPDTPSPGSPVIVAEDFKSASNLQQDVPDASVGIADDDILRTKSVTSSTTVDDEEDLDEEMYKAEDMKGPLVDTLLEWREGGHRVYVTGTFCGWVKKSKLYQQHPHKDGVFSAVIGLPPGTHHVTFFVDDVPRTARHLPTAVDYAGSLVNYIEVPQPDPSAEQPSTQEEAASPSQKASHQVHDPNQSATLSPRTQASYASPGVHPPMALPPPTPELKPSGTPTATHVPTRPKGPDRTVSSKAPRSSGPALTRKIEEKKRYHSEIPQFLLDYDATEDSSRAERAEAVMSTQPAPPTLPMFLTKSVLTTQTPLKDDASVLAYPNHTTLNHLMTCNIKDAVLAVSATTRYKSKFVTTIIFRPVDDEEDEQETGGDGTNAAN